MNAIKAIVKAGRVEAQVPPEWPDGIEVEIQPLVPSGSRDDEGPLSPEEIARTLAAMDRMEALDMTDEERAAWEAECQARKEWEKTHFAEHAEKLQRMWE
jgi:hypothetical protein